jgi:tetratricopeptide (TPR) repeat protein
VGSSTLAWRCRALAPAGLLALAGLSAGLTLPGPAYRQPTSLNALLADHLSGNTTAVSSSLGSPADFRRLRLSDQSAILSALGPFEPSKAVFLLEIAIRATDVAPHFVRPVLHAGRRYLTDAPPELGAERPAFATLWHRVALGLLLQVGSPALTEEYLMATPPLLDEDEWRVDPRLLLIHAVAQEQRCRLLHPALTRSSAGIDEVIRTSRTAPDGSQRPSRSTMLREDEAREECLQETLVRLEFASGREDTRVEALVRAGWTHYELGELELALERLSVGRGCGDPEVEYWAALFSGRVLGALGRFESAAAAYREALAAWPDAQSASVGLALTLFQLERPADADAVARSFRAASPAHDPWWTYGAGDYRWVHVYLARLREQAR